MDDKKCKTLIGSGIGLGVLGALLTILSPCCTLPVVFAFLTSLGLSAAVIHFSGSLLIGVGVLLLMMSIIFLVRKKQSNNKERCCTKR